MPRLSGFLKSLTPQPGGRAVVCRALQCRESSGVVAMEDALAEYEFWTRIITEEVERLRFNQGFEPLKFNLYPNLGKQKRLEPDFTGIAQIGRRKFRVVARKTFDADGGAVIQVEVTPKQPTSAEEAARWATSSKRLYNEK